MHIGSLTQIGEKDVRFDGLKKIYDNVGMLCMACYLMFKHWVYWK
jgi:hypothetical protein